MLPTLKPATFRLPVIVVSICTTSDGGSAQFCASITFNGVLNPATTCGDCVWGVETHGALAA